MFGHPTRPATRPKLCSLAATLLWQATPRGALSAPVTHSASALWLSAFNVLLPMLGCDQLFRQTRARFYFGI